MFDTLDIYWLFLIAAYVVLGAVFILAQLNAPCDRFFNYCFHIQYNPQHEFFHVLISQYRVPREIS